MLDWVQTGNVSILTLGSFNTCARTPSVTANPIRSAMLSGRTLQLELRGRILEELGLSYPRATQTLAKPTGCNRLKTICKEAGDFSLIARFLTNFSRQRRTRYPSHPFAMTRNWSACAYLSARTPVLNHLVSCHHLFSLTSKSRSRKDARPKTSRKEFPVSGFGPLVLAPIRPGALLAFSNSPLSRQLRGHGGCDL